MYVDGTFTVTVRPVVHADAEAVVVSDTVDIQPIPIVTVTSVDSFASETGADPGLFRFTRVGDPTQSLAVTLSIGGTATNGVDDVAIPTSISFQPGESTADLVVTPIDDSSVEATETVVVSIVASPDYDIVAGNLAATVTIADDELIVTNVGDSGAGSLRQAILDANAHEGADTIAFAIPGSAPFSIALASPLPAITDPVVLDAATQPGYAPQQPVIEIDGTNAGPQADGLVVTAGNTTIHGLVVERFGGGGSGAGGAGIVLAGPVGGNVVIENTITSNRGAGVVITDGAANAVDADAIFANGGLGIDLGGDGVTPNDALDSDTGPNNLQNFPSVTMALSSGGTTTIEGTLDSTPDSQFTLQFFANSSCDVSGHGQGATFLGSMLVTTDSVGDVSWSTALPIGVPTGWFITATARNALSGTSEFSACQPVNPWIILNSTLNMLTRDVTAFPIGLAVPAPPSGVTINLASTDGSIATVPLTASVQGGGTSAVVNLTTGAVAGTATITAAATGYANGSSQVTVSLRTMTMSSTGSLVALAHQLTGSIDLAQPAPVGGATITLASSDPSLVAVSPSTVTIDQGAQTASFTITGNAAGSVTISAAADGFAAATLDVTATVNSTISLGSVVVAPGIDAGIALSLGVPAPAGGVTIFLSSNNPSVATVTPSVFIAEGLQIPVANPVVHGVSIGSTQIVATAVGLAPDANSVTVTLATTLSPNPLNVVQGQVANATLTLSSPAPVSGLTFNTSADNTGVATVPAQIQVDGGATTAQVPITGVALGDTVLRASLPGIAETTTAISVKAAPVITVANATVGKDLQLPMGGVLGTSATGNLLVTITSLDPSRVLLATTSSAIGAASIAVTVTAGSSVIPTFYVQALSSSGAVAIQTSAQGYATQMSTITLTPAGFLLSSASFTTNTLSANTTLTVVAQPLNASTMAPLGTPQGVRAGASVTVPITTSDASVGTIIGTLNFFNAGDSSETVMFDPIGAGTATINLGTPSGFATPASGQQITATVNATPAINVANVSVGKDLQVLVGGTLGAPAPAGNLQVTITSLDPGKVLLSTDATTAGQPTVTVAVGAGSGTIPNFYVQALVGTGSATLQITAQDYATDTSTITLLPSGFVLTTSSFSTTTFSGNSILSVAAELLNPSTLAPLGQQEVRGGLAGIVVPISSATPTVGTIVTNDANHTPITQVVFDGGTGATRTAAFDPAASGTSTISVSTPTGFSTPSTGQQITATVTAPNITIGSVTVGRDLQTTVSITLGAAPPSAVDVTVTSNNDTTAKITTIADKAQDGRTTVTLQNVTSISAGSIVVQGRAIGSTTLTVTASGYNTATATVTVNPAGFRLGTTNFSTTTFSGNTAVNINADVLNPATLAPLGIQQEVRGGLAGIVVPISSSTPTVGTIVTNDANHTPITQVVFDGGTGATRTAAFDPAASGTSTISVSTPTGFSTPSTGQQITATVTAPNITIGSVTVGRDLQTTVSITLGAAPPSAVDVTVTSNNDTTAKITTIADKAQDGRTTVTLQNVTSISAGSIVVQGWAVGSTTITVRAAGFNDGTATVTVNPAGFRLGTTNFSTTTFSGNTAVNINADVLNPATLAPLGIQQEVRGGLAGIVVPISSSTPTVGTIVTNDANHTPITQVVFDGGTGAARTAAFDPAASGTSTISVSTPTGFSTPSTGQQITATVTAPNITIGSVTVGRDLQTTVSITLGAAPPSAVDVTVTSNNDTTAKITTLAARTQDGGTTVTLQNVTTSSAGSIVVQGWAIGSTTLTVTAPGYNPATATVTVDPSGFYIQSPGSFTTTTTSANRLIVVAPARLNPVTLNFVTPQDVRGGLDVVTVPISSSNTNVGTIIGTLQFNPGASTATVSFDPLAVGITTISIGTPAGFATPSNLQQITATVNP